jgi:hypothetical protein
MLSILKKDSCHGQVWCLLNNNEYNCCIITKKSTTKAAINEAMKQDAAIDIDMVDSNATVTKKKKKKSTTSGGGSNLKPNVLCFDGGCVHISDEGYQYFLKAYASDLLTRFTNEKNTEFNNYHYPNFYFNEIATKADEVVRVWFELDLYVKLDDYTKQFEHQIDVTPNGLVWKISQTLIQVLRSCFSNGDQMHISVIVECPNGKEKYQSREINRLLIVKYGLHLKVPEIFVKTSHLAILRCAFIEALEGIDLNNYGIVDKEHPPEMAQKVLNAATWTQVIDESPIGAGRGLRIVGSHKTNPCETCGKLKTKQSSCEMCKGLKKVHQDRYYWPEVWFYEGIANPLSALNVTEWMGEDIKKCNAGQMYTYMIHDHELIRKLIYLTSIKTN